jgi:hypothetical protein
MIPVNAFNKIVARFNVSKSFLAVVLNEQLTIAFSRDPGPLSTADFTVTAGAAAPSSRPSLQQPVTQNFQPRQIPSRD